MLLKLFKLLFLLIRYIRNIIKLADIEIMNGCSLCNKVEYKKNKIKKKNAVVNNGAVKY